MVKEKLSIAVIDSYNLIRCAFSQQLRLMNFNVVIEAKDGKDFMEQTSYTAVPELCILNIDTAFINEFTTATDIKWRYPDMKIIAYTLYEKNYPEIEEYGIDIFMPKSISPEELEITILKLMQGNEDISGRNREC